MSNGMEQKYALGLPRHSVRALIALFMTIAFIALHLFMLWKTAGGFDIDMGIFTGILGSFNAVYAVIMTFYFKTRESEDKNEANQIETNSTTT